MIAEQQENFFEIVVDRLAVGRFGFGAGLLRSRAGSLVDARWSSGGVTDSAGCQATKGCFAMRASSFAMSSGFKTKSTHPAAIALRGIESYRAESSCANV